MTRQIANIITGFRILGTIVLLFVPVFSLEFYVTKKSSLANSSFLCIPAAKSAEPPQSERVPLPAQNPRDSNDFSRSGDTD